jgi:hypothetical protein
MEAAVGEVFYTELNDILQIANISEILTCPQSHFRRTNKTNTVRFEVFTLVAMKNAIFWDVMLSG